MVVDTHVHVHVKELSNDRHKTGVIKYQQSIVHVHAHCNGGSPPTED